MQLLKNLESEERGDGEPVTKPQKSDIDKMHIYRDAIRDRAGNRVVVYAAILYPGTTQEYTGADIAALQANPANCAALHHSLSNIIHQAVLGKQD